MVALDLASVHRCPCIECQLHPDGSLAQEHRLLNQLLATVDERSRRLYAAFLAIHCGRGGLTKVARITGLSRMTLRRGRHELFEPERRERPKITWSFRWYSMRSNDIVPLGQHFSWSEIDQRLFCLRDFPFQGVDPFIDAGSTMKSRIRSCPTNEV